MRRLARSRLGRSACLVSLALACTAAPGPEQRRAAIASEPTLTPTELAPTSEFIHIDGHGADLRGPDPVSADGRVTMHFVLVSSCDEEGATHEYSLSRRDVATGETEPLASGDSRAGAALGPEGSIYLEVGGRIERFAPGQRESIEDVPNWVHFETPGYGHDCSI